MNLILVRKKFYKDSTIGTLSIGDKPFCSVCEDTDRGLYSNLPGTLQKKIQGQTAIPYGTYEVKITYSQRFKKKLPLLLNVPGYEGVRIHPGNTHKDTEGCLLPGEDAGNGTVKNSRVCFNKLMEVITKALESDKVFITILKV